MKLVIVKDYDAMSLAAANEVMLAIQTNPQLRLGLATGGTPEGMYRELIHATQKNNLDWESVVTFNLDEYVGISKHHPLSYSTYMHEKFFDHVNIRRKNVHLPKGTGNPERNIAKYEKALAKAGGIDLQILGIGENAHIAFNEPGASKDDHVRVVELTPSTIEANARYFNSPEEVPRSAITMGIGDILKAKRIILLASGLKKAEAIQKTMEATVSPEAPSTFLQLHNDVTLIADEDAASLLRSEKEKALALQAKDKPKVAASTLKTKAPIVKKAATKSKVTVQPKAAPAKVTKTAAPTKMTSVPAKAVKTTTPAKVTKAAPKKVAASPTTKTKPTAKKQVATKLGAKRK